VPRRVLVVGASDDPRVVAVARALPADGLLICIEPDREAARRAVAAFEHERLSGRSNVMIGEPSLVARKVSGPFDLILTAAAPDERLSGQLQSRLAPGGLIRTL
jgi:predicted O-methyltransferase YrrM